MNAKSLAVAAILGLSAVAARAAPIITLDTADDFSKTYAHTNLEAVPFTAKLTPDPAYLFDTGAFKLVAASTGTVIYEAAPGQTFTDISLTAFYFANDSTRDVYTIATSNDPTFATSHAVTAAFTSAGTPFSNDPYYRATFQNSAPLATTDKYARITMGASGGNNYWVRIADVTLTTTAVPEPGSLALLAGCSLIMLRRRRA